MSLGPGDRVSPIRTVDGWMTPDMVGTIVCVTKRPHGHGERTEWFRVDWDGDDAGHVSALQLRKVGG